jgi:hypothetical protein
VERFTAAPSLPGVLDSVATVTGVRVHLSRDSVTAGDDVEDHDEVAELDGRRPFSLVLAELLGRRYLPLISGGRATWLVRAGRLGTPLAVVAQEWPVPELLVESSASLSAVGDSLHFEYQAQGDPRAALELWRSTDG